MLKSKMKYLKQLYILRHLGFKYIQPHIDIKSNNTLDNVLPNDIVSLRKIISNCSLCDLCKSRKSIVMPKGSHIAKLFLVFAYPTINEDSSSDILSGKQGVLLDKILNSVFNISIANTYMTHILKCKPSPKKLDDLTSNISTCKEYLLKELQLVSPDLIIVFGEKSLSYILENENNESFFQECAGNILQFHNYNLMPTLSLGELLSNPTNKKDAYKHFLNAKNFLGI